MHQVPTLNHSFFQNKHGDKSWIFSDSVDILSESNVNQHPREKRYDSKQLDILNALTCNNNSNRLLDGLQVVGLLRHPARWSCGRLITKYNWQPNNNVVSKVSVHRQYDYFVLRNRRTRKHIICLYMHPDLFEILRWWNHLWTYKWRPTELQQL